MPSSPSSRLGLTAPLGSEAALGPANLLTLASELEAKVGMVKIATVNTLSSGYYKLTGLPTGAYKHLKLIGRARKGSGSSGPDLIFSWTNGGISGAPYSQTIRDLLAGTTYVTESAVNRALAGKLPVTATGGEDAIVEIDFPFWERTGKRVWRSQVDFMHSSGTPAYQHRGVGVVNSSGAPGELWLRDGNAFAGDMVAEFDLYGIG